MCALEDFAVRTVCSRCLVAFLVRLIISAVNAATFVSFLSCR
jgi:hypothetical protein